MANGTYGTGHTHVTTHHRSGWVGFAALLMVVSGIFEGISGLVAIFKPSLYLVNNNQLLVMDYRQWGWVQLIWGIVLIVSASSLLAGRLWGRILAITLATISAILNFGFIWAYPVWSIMIILLDIIVIYSVAMYGGREEEEYES